MGKVRDHRGAFRFDRSSASEAAYWMVTPVMQAPASW
jgi:hypothetical protein